MQIEAAVFRKAHEPLTIEAVEIDKPLGPRGAGAHGRDRACATATCTSSTGSGAFRSTGRSCSATRAPGWSRRWARTSPRFGSATTSSPAFRAFAAAARNASAGTPTSAPAASSRRKDGETAAPVAGRPAVPPVHRHLAAMPRGCCCTRIRWCGSTPTSRSIARRWSAAAC